MLAAINRGIAMNKWKRNRLVILEANRNLNVAAMDRAGFGVDQCRVLTADELAAIAVTPMDQIRDCRLRTQFAWR